MVYMNDSELISVVIPTYGRADLLEGAILSVLEQTYKVVEVIVVDDNDDVSEYRRKTEKLMEKFWGDIRVHYIQNPRNSGGCVARNNGVACAKGQWIAFLDDDDYYLPDYLYEMHKRAIESATDMVYLDRAYCDDARHVYRSRKKCTNLPEGDIFLPLLKGTCPVSIFILLKKHTFLEAGGFDPELAGYQDFDLWMKIARNAKVAACTTAHAVYRRDNRKRITSNPDKRERDLHIVAEKWKLLLSDAEKVCFQGFCSAHRKQILLKKISECKTFHGRMRLIKLYNKMENNVKLKIKVLISLFIRKRALGIDWFIKQGIFRRYEELV